MKLITIEIENIDYPKLPPQYVKVKPIDLKVSTLSDMDSISTDMTKFLEEVYPMSTFAYGKHWETFYIRDKDKKPLEDLLNAYINRAVYQTVKKIIDHIVESGGKSTFEYLEALIDEAQSKLDPSF